MYTLSLGLYLPPFIDSNTASQFGYWMLAKSLKLKAGKTQHLWAGSNHGKQSTITAAWSWHSHCHREWACLPAWCYHIIWPQSGEACHHCSFPVFILALPVKKNNTQPRVLSRISYQGGVSKYQGVLPFPFPSLPHSLSSPIPLPSLSPALSSPPLEVPLYLPSLFSLPFHSPPLPLPPLRSRALKSS